MNQEEILEALNTNHVDDKGKQIFLDLYKKNNDLFDTIDFAILDTKYTSKFTTNELLRITCDKKIQNSLINLDNNQYELFFKLKDNFLDENNWITGTNAILKAFNNNEFSILINDVAMNNNPSVLASYYALINQDRNYFGITTIEQLKNFEQIREDVCDSIIASPENTDLLPDVLKDMSSIDRYKFAIIEKNYGISLSQAKLLCQKYAFDIENSDDIVCTEETHKFLTELTQIIKAEDIEHIENLQSLDNTKHYFLDIDSDIRDSFKEMYNNAFYKPKSEDLKGHEIVDGEEIEIYDAGTNFTMCSHVVGAYFSVDKDEDFNYKDNWNRPQMANHAFCTRLISNEALETANNQGVCFGFVDFEGNSMLSSAPWDLCTARKFTQKLSS